MGIFEEEALVREEVDEEPPVQVTIGDVARPALADAVVVVVGGQKVYCPARTQFRSGR